MKAIHLIYTFLILLSFCSCGKKEPKIIDEANKTFYVNGISAADGYEKIAKSLTDMGFVMDKEGPLEVDLTLIGQPITYSVNYRIKSLTDAQASKLTGGIFDNLPSGIAFSGIEPKESWRVYLSWLKTGEVVKCLITFNEFLPIFEKEDFREVNRRLSVMFPHSKIANKQLGFKEYYDDNGVSAYCADSYTLELEKKDN